MKIEKFVGTSDEGKYTGHFDEVVRTTSSDGNRRDAHQHPAEKIKFNSFSEEYDYLIARKQFGEAELGRLKQELKEMHTAHMAARGSWEKWQAILEPANREIESLKDVLKGIYERMSNIKLKAKREQNIANGKENNIKHVLEEIRELLVQILGAMKT